MNEKPRKVIGYLRVSTINQDLEKNKADILAYCNDHDLGKVHFVQEIVSGKVSWKRIRIKEVIDQLGKDDWLIVPELSRLGRSMLEIMEIIAEAKRKEINIYAIKNNWTLNGTMEISNKKGTSFMIQFIERDEKPGSLTKEY